MSDQVPRRWLAFVPMTCAFVVGAGGQRPTHYESNVEVTGIAAVRDDATGGPSGLRFEVSFVECPGAQGEVLRGVGGPAACLSKYKVGDRLKAAIRHERAEDGDYRWSLRALGDCTGVHHPNEDGEYAFVRECGYAAVDGAPARFRCRELPDKELLDRCPWFKRR